MRQLNGIYTQASNRRHGRSGHLFQGRYKAILVDEDSYLLELTRYVVLNPVRAGMVELPGDRRWSSYLDMLGARSAPHWLAIDGLLAQFAVERQEAVRWFDRKKLPTRNRSFVRIPDLSHHEGREGHEEHQEISFSSMKRSTR